MTLQWSNKEITSSHAVLPGLRNGERKYVLAAEATSLNSGIVL